MASTLTVLYYRTQFPVLTKCNTIFLSVYRPTLSEAESPL